MTVNDGGHVALLQIARAGLSNEIFQMQKKTQESNVCEKPCKRTVEIIERFKDLVVYSLVKGDDVDVTAKPYPGQPAGLVSVQHHSRQRRSRNQWAVAHR